MTDLTRYAYDARTGVFAGKTEAHPDPMNPGKLLEPWATTMIAPPIAPAGQAIIWNGAAWALVADRRGEVWFTGTDPVLIDFLGDPAAHGLTKAPKLPPAAPPSSCSKLGLKRAFEKRGLWTTVREMIASDASMQEEWDLAIEIQKSDPLIQVAIAGLAQKGIALSDAAVDELIADAVAAVAPKAA